jgi:hypothetical protein
MTIAESTTSARGPSAADLQTMWDTFQIERVINAERNGKDLGLWDQMDAAFHPEAKLGGFWFIGTATEFIESSKQSFAAGVRQSHLIGPLDIRINGDRALAEFNMFIRSHMKFKGVDAVSHTSVRAYDRLERRDGAWRILEMNVVYQNADTQAVNAWETLSIDRAVLESYPPTYRYVAANLANHGIELRYDVLGVDRPEPVEALVRSDHQWLSEA